MYQNLVTHRPVVSLSEQIIHPQVPTLVHPVDHSPDDQLVHTPPWVGKTQDNCAHGGGGHLNYAKWMTAQTHTLQLSQVKWGTNLL